MAAVRVIALACAVLVIGTACTSRTRSIAVSTSPSASDVTSASSAPITLASSDMATESTTTPPPSTSIPASTASSAPAPSKPAGTGCSTAGLTITAQRGSGASGQEFATLVFHNNGTKSCTLAGFPGVSLRLKGAALGSPASRSSAAAKIVTIAAGASASADLTVNSTCNADVSDMVRIYPPNETHYVDVPIALRGCPMVVTPVTAS